MAETSEIIKHFYSSFQKKDYAAMQACYADNATFSDAVFLNLNAAQVRAMWEMLCKKGKDLKIEFKNIQADSHSGTADWVATYTFSATGKPVENKIKAHFTFKDGKIISHRDEFDFYHWARQALGLTGLLLGWTTFLKKKVQTKARNNLADFTAK